MVKLPARAQEVQRDLAVSVGFVGQTPRVVRAAGIVADFHRAVHDVAAGDAVVVTRNVTEAGSEDPLMVGNVDRVPSDRILQDAGANLRRQLQQR